MKKNKLIARKEAIQELIKELPIENQETIVELLKEKYGITTNQSIVSRDLRELNVTKRKFKDALIYELQELNVHKEILRLGVVDVLHNETMIVIKTLPGLAAFVGDYLDAFEGIDLLATLAGENIVFVTPLSIKNIDKVFEAICKIVHFKPLSKKDRE
jgi:transcriptional regulator of arginine metabolism